MSLSIDETVSDGLDRLTDIETIWYVGALFLVNLGVIVGPSSQLQGQEETLEDDFGFLDVDLTPEEFPLAIDMPLGIAILVWLLSMILFVTVSLVVFDRLSGFAEEIEPSDDPTDSTTVSANDDPGSTRSIEEGVSDWDRPNESDPEPTEFDRIEPSSVEERPNQRESLTFGTLVVMTAHGLLATILLGILISVGLVLLVLPGLFIATVFLFTQPFIATDRLGAIRSMRRSFELTKGNRLSVFGVLVVLVLSFFAISFVGGILALAFTPFPIASQLIDIAAGSIAWLVVLSLMSSAYDQLRAAQRQERSRWEGIDDELLP